jgi:hypothetical protein
MPYRGPAGNVQIAHTTSLNKPVVRISMLSDIDVPLLAAMIANPIFGLRNVPDRLAGTTGKPRALLV